MGRIEFPSEDGSFIKLRAKEREENRVQGRCFGGGGSLSMFLRGRGERLKTSEGDRSRRIKSQRHQR